MRNITSIDAGQNDIRATHVGTKFFQKVVKGWFAFFLLLVNFLPNIANGIKPGMRVGGGALLSDRDANWYML